MSKDIDKQRLLLLEARAGDARALDELMNDLRPMVKTMARGYFLTNGDTADLIQEGMIGLYKAFLSYDLESKATFSTYASICIRRQMISAVRTSLSQKNLPLNQYIGIGAQGGLILDGGEQDLEYTLPDVSQSVIITRMAGRTPVPERESIASFAAHHATMVVFLSTGLLKELSRELIAGGYEPDTPAAIVYKATWPEEKTLICTVETLAQTAEENGITKTALMIIGDVVTHSQYQRSELYNPAFTTEFRKGTAPGGEENCE